MNNKEKYFGKFKLNGLEENTKQITEDIIEKYKNSKKIYIMVAFITYYFIEEYIDKLKDKEIEIITTTKNSITTPFVLERLVKEENVDLYLYNDDLMHGKIIIFEDENMNHSFTIGSMNLTFSAIEGKNVELNLVDQDDEKNALRVFNLVKEKSTKITSVDCNYLTEYRETYNRVDDIYPNVMQLETLRNFKNNIDKWNKSLLVSATGTGKTYMSAFAGKEYLKRFGGKILFIVHNRTILQSAIKSYKRVFQERSTLEIKETKDLNKIENNDLIFITDKLGSKNIDKLLEFDFKFIVFDEVHKLGYSSQITKNEKIVNKMTSYYKIFNEFNKIQQKYQPRRIYLFGMTATPYRSHSSSTKLSEFEDSEKFLTNIFDNNILNYILLSDAIEKKFITEFKYYGVVVNEDKNEKIDSYSSLKLYAETALRKLKEVGIYDTSKKVKGLIFVSSIENAKKINEIINNDLTEFGYKSKYITGENSQSEVDKAIKELELNEEKGKTKSNDKKGINFIITIDKFNEGVDIPTLNTIIMLRPTWSQIIYTQQIGRGLRNIEGEQKYLTLIDLVGNDKHDWISTSAITKDSLSFKFNAVQKIIEEARKNNLWKDIDEISYYKIIQSLSSKYVEKKKFKYRIFRDVQARKISFNSTDSIGKSIIKLLRYIEKEYNWDISKVRNILINKTRFNPKVTKPWLVELKELVESFYKENTDKNIDNSDNSMINQLNNLFIEKLSWMTLTVSKKDEKIELLKLLSNETAKLGYKWKLYFRDELAFTDEDRKKELKKERVNGKAFFIVKKYREENKYKEYIDTFESKNDDPSFDSLIELKCDIAKLIKLSKQEGNKGIEEYIEIIKELLKEYQLENNYLNQNQIYTRSEALFQFNLVYSPENADIDIKTTNNKKDIVLLREIKNDELNNENWENPEINKDENKIYVTYNKIKNKEKLSDYSNAYLFIENNKIKNHSEVKSFIYIGAADVNNSTKEFTTKKEIKQEFSIKNIDNIYDLIENNRKIFSEMIKNNK